ncbi:hypothetical protein [Candidatus Phytoplasma meliae]|uniref:Uncharacterized protein n=1 Tax=Candidatus Phytoplasma meliae TaxID=1848402 RepID=A0ABS5CYQ6_9MOLU|nr:hypothetical protein [Candidatus Phytoplasma meliae]MBP5836111.1 hypothetical protein [Candidatus Phytoplasma meliae]
MNDEPLFKFVFDNYKYKITAHFKSFKNQETIILNKLKEYSKKTFSQLSDGKHFEN